MDDGALGDGDVDEGLDGVVLGRRLRGDEVPAGGGRGLRWVGGPGLGEGPGGVGVGWFCVVAYAVLSVLAWAPAWVWGRVWGWGPVWVWGWVWGWGLVPG